jgi:prolyl-tRNA synthetase
MALPVIAGQKSDAERFAGAVRTYCIEAMMQDGKALQAGTSHLLGQNFARAFEVKFLNAEGHEEFVWQTSWGVSTRLIGGLIMAHSDDKGLVLPPRLAPTQAVIIPIGTAPEELEATQAKAQELAELLKAEGVSVKIDTREMRPGAKFFDWEKKGVPLRLELGPKDLAAGSLVVVRRDTSDKKTVSEEELIDSVKDLLEQIQRDLFQAALARREAQTRDVNSYDELKEAVETGFARAFWCGSAECETKIKDETKATIRSIPFDQKAENGKCVVCGKKSAGRVVIAKAY